MNKAKYIWPAIWCIQLVSLLVLLYQIMKLDMLPDRYLAMLGGAMALALAIGALLLLPPKRGIAAHLIGSTFVIAVAVLSIMGINVISKANTTLEEVTAPPVIDQEYDRLIGVYVAENDSAVVFTDLSGYTFGMAEDALPTNPDGLLEVMESSVGSPITVRRYATMTELADAFRAGEIQAFFLDTTTEDLLMEADEFAEFLVGTRCMYEIPVTDPTPAPEEKPLYIYQPLEPEKEKVDTPEHNITNTPFAIYISGSDTRDRMLTVARSDVNILAIVNPTNKQVLLVNTPRDYYVPNPAGRGALDKLTHCGIYGIDCSAQAIANLYNVDIDYTFQINFTGFETLIDALGGVDVYSDTTFSNGKFSYIKGMNYMNGEEALAFARDRYNQQSGDNARGIHQMAVIKAVITKLASAKTLLTNYQSIMESMKGMFTTSLGADNIAMLIKMQLDDMASWDVKSYAVTGFNGSEKTYSMPQYYAYVMYPNEETVDHAKELVSTIMKGMWIKEV